jgi:hypothetical protein
MPSVSIPTIPNKLMRRVSFIGMKLTRSFQL